MGIWLRNPCPQDYHTKMIGINTAEPNQMSIQYHGGIRAWNMVKDPGRIRIQSSIKVI